MWWHCLNESFENIYPWFQIKLLQTNISNEILTKIDETKIQTNFYDINELWKHFDYEQLLCIINYQIFK